MNKDLWLYANNEQQQNAAASLIVFSFEILKRAKFIAHLDLLKEKLKLLRQHKIAANDDTIMEFIMESLVDSIRVLIFIENYMKAELIRTDFCVHRIKKDSAGFRELYQAQLKRPIKLIEIHEIKPFTVDKDKQIITHPAISENTIGMHELLGSDDYKKNYRFDESLIPWIMKLNKYRNQLHFKKEIEFQLSNSLVDNLEKINDFADNLVSEITHPAKS